MAITILKDKNIILGVTGSIACYKAVDLASKLTQAGALVDVVMTVAAQKFVAPVTFQAVTGRPVYTSMWNTAGDALPTHIAHVGLGENADLFVIAPITAHTIARLVQGLADDLLAVTALAARCRLMIAPAMDGGMYSHPATQFNIKILQSRGVVLVPPDEGRFASGLVGKGRLPDTYTLIGKIRKTLGAGGVFSGKKVVISAGGTRESIDPVRYITNHSSGKQGYSLAQAALDAGAREVVLVSAARGLPIPIGANFVAVDTAESMLDAVSTHSVDADLLVMAAAVADFRPEMVAGQKIKKHSGEGQMSLQLIRTKDILLEIKKQRDKSGFPRIVVGFAAESENLLDNARAKLENKGLDLMIANDITAPDAGFRSDSNRVIILDKDGRQQSLELAHKSRIAEKIILHCADLLKS